jgi:hypothetical protein
VVVSPSEIDFGPHPVGHRSHHRRVRLTNKGPGPLSIGDIALDNEDDFSYGGGCGQTLARKSSCTINVVFRPHAPGDRVGTLRITDNAGDSPQEVKLKGHGVLIARVSPDGLNFGRQTVNATSDWQEVTLSARRGGPLRIESIEAGGEFIQRNRCPQSLREGRSCTIKVRFAPTIKGRQVGNLTITDNAENSPQVIPLKGHGVR